MTQLPSRTSEDELKQLTYFYRLFRPNELAFVLQLNESWSVYDRNRCNTIAKLLREAFNSNQSSIEVRAAIDFYNSERSISFYHNKPLQIMLQSHSANIHLSPGISACPLCGKQLGAEKAEKKSVSVYRLKGVVLKGKFTNTCTTLFNYVSSLNTGTIFTLTCKHEKTTHHLTSPIFLYPNFIRQTDMDTYTTATLHNSDFVYLGGEYAFERSLIEMYMCQLLGSPISWNKFIDGHNLHVFNETGIETTNWQKHFSHWYMKYYVILFDLSIGAKQVIVPRTTSDFDNWAWTSFPRLLTSFVYLWSNHKTIIGPCNSNCSRCVIIDGHQKCRRRVCRAKEVEVKTPEFNVLKTGCFRTPIRRTQHCEAHQQSHRSSKRPQSALKKLKNLTRQHSLLYQKGRNTNNQFDATNCRTFKERSEKYIKQCSRSFGVLAAVSNCKVIITFSEIFRSETLREIVHLLCSTIRGI